MYSVNLNPIGCSNLGLFSLDCSCHCVSGKLAVENLLENPTNIVVDSMHQVLLGEPRSFLIKFKALYMAPKTRDKICQDLNYLQLQPIQRQKLRSLNHLKHWKASEFEVFFFMPFICSLGRLRTTCFVF